ncbi:MAG: class I SAM-dependent methyltransferase [Candidatus Aminicenantes bacterium]|nr:class I SAM-dependent methyltransferase [Candidatus Aminicenantes bacterium]
MKRTIEKLHHERVEKEQDWLRRFQQLERAARDLTKGKAFVRIDERLDKLEKTLASNAGLEAAAPDLLDALRDMRGVQAQGLDSLQTLAGLLSELHRLGFELGDARDREWDALGSNHVGMIFKSMEWRVEKLAAAYDDVSLLMRSFLALEDKLGRLLAVLEKKNMPTPREAADLLEPIRDWRYAGFETRFRGGEEDIRRQQKAYLELFPQGGRVLDLGCGRGEFMDMLRENGLRSLGVDLNSQMVGLCLDKGLDCRRGDLLEVLAGEPDRSLDGVFSSQVVEHLGPEAIRRLVELAFQKLKSGGTLVLETVNPLSVFALVHIYFLDMSHRTPVHPQALRFLLESAGFENVELRESQPLEAERLQALPASAEASDILNRNIDSLNALLFAPPNFAAVGRKP